MRYETKRSARTRYMKRQGYREIPLDINGSVNTIYGTTDSKSALAFYVKGKAWIKPKDKIDFKNAGRTIESRFNRSLKSMLASSPHFSTDCICEFNAKENALKQGKNSLLCFDVYLRQKGTPLPIKEMENPIKESFNGILGTLVGTLEELNFAVSKGKS